MNKTGLMLLLLALPAAAQTVQVEGFWPSAGGTGYYVNTGATYVDSPNGGTTVIAHLLISTTTSETNACSVFYIPGSAVFALWNNAHTSYTTLPKNGGVLSNGQCSIDTNSVSTFVNIQTAVAMSLQISFTTSFAGAKNIYAEAIDVCCGGASTGWVLEGTWTVGTAPGPTLTFSGVSPVSGTGLSQTFTGSYSDTYGTGARPWQYIMVGPSSAVPAPHANACDIWLNWPDSTPAKYFMLNDAGTGVVGTTPGGAKISNSQCTFDPVQSSYVVSGTTTVVHWSITFNPAWAGTKNVYFREQDAGYGIDSGWTQEGTWTVGNTIVLPTVVSLTPNSVNVPVMAPGQADPARTIVFTASVASALGAADIIEAGILITNSAPGSPTSPPANSCPMRYNAAAMTFNLDGDLGGSDWGGDLAVGYYDGDYNSQCIALSQYLSVTTAGNQLSFNVGLGFESNFGSNVYVYATNANGSTGYVLMGSLLITQPQGMTVDYQHCSPGTTIYYTSASTLSDVITCELSITDQNGFNDIQEVKLAFDYNDPNGLGNGINQNNSCVMDFWNGGLHGTGFRMLDINNINWSATQAVGGSWVLYNGTTKPLVSPSCKLLGQYSSIVTAYNTMILRFGVRFFLPPPFTPAPFQATYAISKDGATNTGIIEGGQWNFQDPGGTSHISMTSVHEPLELTTEECDYVFDGSGNAVPNVDLSISADTPEPGSGMHVHELFGQLRNAGNNNVNITFPQGSTGKSNAKGLWCPAIQMPSYAGIYPFYYNCPICLNQHVYTRVTVWNVSDPNPHLLLNNPALFILSAEDVGIYAGRYQPHGGFDWSTTTKVSNVLTYVAADVANFGCGGCSHPRKLWVTRCALPTGGTNDDLFPIAAKAYWYELPDWHNDFHSCDVSTPKDQRIINKIQADVSSFTGCSTAPVQYVLGVIEPNLLHINCL